MHILYALQTRLQNLYIAGSSKHREREMYGFIVKPPGWGDDATTSIRGHPRDVIREEDEEVTQLVRVDKVAARATTTTGGGKGAEEEDDFFADKDEDDDDEEKALLS